jgi:TolB protein
MTIYVHARVTIFCAIIVLLLHAPVYSVAQVASQPRPIVFLRTLTPRLYAMNIDGSNLHRLGNGPHDTDPVWSPDGRKIACIRRTLRLPRVYVINADGSGTALSLAAIKDPYNDLMPVWSLDSRYVAYQHVTGGLPSYYQAAVDGPERKQISESEYKSRFVVKLYQGGKVNVISKPADSHTAYLYRVGEDGTTLTQLTHGEYQDTAPILSPDGKQVAFLRAYRYAHVYIMNPDGSGRKRLTAGFMQDYTPQLSPDGTQILFRRYSDEDISGLYVMHPDGSALQRLPGTGPSAQRFCWSPDSKSIVFSLERNNGWQMYQMAQDGTGLTRLTEGNDSVQAWIGTTLYFVRLDGRSSQAYTLTMDGSRRMQSAPDVYKHIQPAFSPDGQRVVFDRYEPGHPEPRHLYLMNRDGTGLTQLTTGDASDVNPTWSPDGTRVVFTRIEAGLIQLYALRLDDKSVNLFIEADGVDDFAHWY